jgi:AraC-like DNA-binding protein
VQHVEFFHRDHFECRYHRRKARKSLSRFIDFFWETDFDPLYARYPEGFSDALFPNVGYTYLINLGTPFVMQLEDASFEMRTDGFLPRHKHMVCHHATGNKIFGIKFRVSPVIFQKKINFSEYREYIFPLAYLMERSVIDAVKKAPDFEGRVKIVSDYYEALVHRYAGSYPQVEVVTTILKECSELNHYDIPVEHLAAQAGVSTRTLQRYFEATTGITSKQAIQIMRIRSAIEKLTTDPPSFRISDFGYYDWSHFHKHLKAFLNNAAMGLVQPHLKLLKGEAL